MRADQWLMLGVGALGLYAVYRLTRASSAPSTQPTGALPSTVHAPLPARPSPIAPPPGLVLISGSPMALANSRAYRGRLETAANTGPYTPNRSADDLAALIEAIGFDGVRVAMNPEDALHAGFPPWSTAGAGQGTRWFYGRWTPPTMRVDRPSALTILWVTSPAGRPDIPSKV